MCNFAINSSLDLKLNNGFKLVILLFLFNFNAYANKECVLAKKIIEQVASGNLIQIASRLGREVQIDPRAPFTFVKLIKNEATEFYDHSGALVASGNFLRTEPGGRIILSVGDGQEKAFLLSDLHTIKTAQSHPAYETNLEALGSDATYVTVLSTGNNSLSNKGSFRVAELDKNDPNYNFFQNLMKKSQIETPQRSLYYRYKEGYDLALIKSEDAQKIASRLKLQIQRLGSSTDANSQRRLAELNQNLADKLKEIETAEAQAKEYYSKLTSLPDYPKMKQSSVDNLFVRKFQEYGGIIIEGMYKNPKTGAMQPIKIPLSFTSHKQGNINDLDLIDKLVEEAINSGSTNLGFVSGMKISDIIVNKIIDIHTHPNVLDFLENIDRADLLTSTPSPTDYKHAVKIEEKFKSAFGSDIKFQHLILPNPTATNNQQLVVEFDPGVI